MAPIDGHVRISFKSHDDYFGVYYTCVSYER